MQAGITVGDLAISIDFPSEEAALVAELQAGSEQAFAQLIDRFHQPLYSLIARSLQDPTDAADITQEVFLKVFRCIRGFHGESSLRTWLYRIALREASNQRRWWSRHKHQEIALDAPCCCHTSTEDEGDALPLSSTLADGCSSPYDNAAQQELREHVEAALLLVPEAFRTVVVMREIEGFAYEEIADILQINLGTVKSRLMRGRAALRAALAATGSVVSTPPQAAARHRATTPAPPCTATQERQIPASDADQLCALVSSLPISAMDSGLEVSQ